MLSLKIKYQQYNTLKRTRRFNYLPFPYRQQSSLPKTNAVPIDRKASHRR
jgi:hypothetical protein